MYPNYAMLKKCIEFSDKFFLADPFTEFQRQTAKNAQTGSKRHSVTSRRIAMRLLYISESSSPFTPCSNRVTPFNIIKSITVTISSSP